MFEKKTATLVMNEKISKRDELPPSLKEAKEKHIHHLNSILTNSTRKADLPIKISESNLTENSDEMNPDPGPTMRIMTSSRLELEEDTTKLSVESTCSVKSYRYSSNKR